MRRAVLLVAMMGVACGQPGNAAPADAGAETHDDDTSGDTTGPALESLEITPSHATLFIDLAGGTAKAAVQEYRAHRIPDLGAPVEVTLETRFELEDTTLGSFEGARFTSATDLSGRRGATTFVHATRSATSVGGAALLLVALDRTKDLFFVSRYYHAPEPAVQVLRAVGGSTTLDLSLALVAAPNPDKSMPASFVTSVRPMSEGDAAAGCAPRATKDADVDGVQDTFVAVEPGGAVCFEITAKTVRDVSPYEGEKFDAVYADVIGAPGDVKLERHSLLFFMQVERTER